MEILLYNIVAVAGDLLVGWVEEVKGVRSSVLGDQLAEVQPRNGHLGQPSSGVMDGTLQMEKGWMASRIGDGRLQLFVAQTGKIFRKHTTENTLDNIWQKILSLSVSLYFSNGAKLEQKTKNKKKGCS